MRQGEPAKKKTGKKEEARDDAGFFQAERDYLVGSVPTRLVPLVICAETGVIVGTPAPTISVRVKLPGAQLVVVQPALLTQTFPSISTPMP